MEEQKKIRLIRFQDDPEPLELGSQDAMLIIRADGERIVAFPDREDTDQVDSYSPEATIIVLSAVLQDEELYNMCFDRVFAGIGAAPHLKLVKNDEPPTDDQIIQRFIDADPSLLLSVLDELVAEIGSDASEVTEQIKVLLDHYGKETTARIMARARANSKEEHEQKK